MNNIESFLLECRFAPTCLKFEYSLHERKRKDLKLEIGMRKWTGWFSGWASLFWENYDIKGWRSFVIQYLTENREDIQHTLFNEGVISFFQPVIPAMQSLSVSDIDVKVSGTFRWSRLQTCGLGDQCCSGNERLLPGLQGSIAVLFIVPMKLRFPENASWGINFGTSLLRELRISARSSYAKL